MLTLHSVPNKTRRGPLRGMTLAEILITIVIVTLAGLSIMASIQAAIYFQQSIREENGATRAAADIIDRTKKEMFFRLVSRTEDVVIDNRGTARTDDDITGIAEIRFYAPDSNGNYFDSDGLYINEVGTDAQPVPLDLTMLIAEVTVRWNRLGRLSETEREVVMTTLLSP